jgi:hypothetical protein
MGGQAGGRGEVSGAFHDARRRETGGGRGHTATGFNVLRWNLNQNLDRVFALQFCFFLKKNLTNKIRF